MNNHSEQVIELFNSKNNRNLLADYLVKFYDDLIVYKFLQSNFNNMMKNFIEYIKEDLYLSDPLPGMTTEKSVLCYNKQFLNDKIKFINSNVLRLDETPKYSVNDGGITTREPRHIKAADALNAWKSNSGRNIQYRMDSQSDYGSQDELIGSGIISGVEFCDQSKLNTSHHVDALLNGEYFRKLNKFPLYDGAVGDGGYDDGRSDERLLSRRIFRNNESGVENGIPRYEQRLYKRFIDRDTRESLPGVERSGMDRSFDMRSLYCRTFARK